jgi:TIR domain
MADLPFNKRPNDVFVSYSHTEGKQVELLVKWLQGAAGLRVWWDSSRLLAGDPLVSALPTGLGSARAALFCVSRSWNNSSWCQHEYGSALQQERADRHYRIIALVLDDCKVPDFMANARYLQMRSLETDTAAALLEALVPEPAPQLEGDRDVYFSCSWHPSDTESANRVGLALHRKYGFRLIGDSPDYAAFDAAGRLKRLVESCGAVVSVLPFRNDAANGFTSKWIVKEVELARDLGRPYLLFAADGVKLDSALTKGALSGRCFPAPGSADDPLLDEALRELDEDYWPSPQMAYSFFAASLRREPEETERAVGMIERVTSIPCRLGQRLQGQHAQDEIVKLIQNAEFLLADISDNDLNSLIEAGIARGAGTRLHLLSRMPESGELHTRFMFRDIEVNWYRNALERLGFAHRIARVYRRRVIVPKAD